MSDTPRGAGGGVDVRHAPRRSTAVIAEGVGVWLEAHWLTVVAVAIGLFLGLAFAAPLLDMAGLHLASSAIYRLYSLSCHQLPQRSWFLGGEALTYDWETVQQHFGLRDAMFWQTFHRPIRDPVLGYQVALCQRDVAVFGALLLTAVALAWTRRFRRVRPLRLPLYALLVLPVAIDGLSQLAGLRESTPLLRTATGALFGAATGLLVLPMVDEGLGDTDTRRTPVLEDEQCSGAPSGSRTPPRG